MAPPVSPINQTPGPSQAQPFEGPPVLPQPTSPPPLPGGPMLPMAPPPPVKMYDVKVKRCIDSGQIKVKTIPPEDFLLDPCATVVNEDAGTFFADIVRITRSDAKLKWPDKKDIIDELPAYTTATDEGMEKQARNNKWWSYRESNPDKNTEEIEVVECYIKCDYDGDGVSEWRQVCVGGAGASGTGDKTHLLANKEWPGSLPYVSITPNPMPHRYRGRSIYDDVGPIQRIKTVLLRQQLDNLYLVNNPQILANQQGVVNPDELLNPTVGGVVWTNGPPNEIAVPLAVPFTAKEIFPALEYWDMTIEKRTGVSRSTMALDLDTLQHQTATAVNAQQSAAFTKVETYARNIAECGGFRELFQKLLKLFVENQKSVKQIRLRDQWVRLDPRGWNANMRVTINIGLGAGSRDRDLAMLGGIAQKIEQGIQALNDPFNPILNIGHLFDVYRRMVETGGIKNPQRWFAELTQQQVAQLGQLKAQNQQPPPEVMKVQAEMQMKQMELAAKRQADADRAALDQAQAQQKAQIEQIQAQADIATQNNKLAAEQEANNQRLQAELAMKEREFQLEKELKILEFRLKAAEQRANLVAGLSKPSADAEGKQTGPDPNAIQGALAQFDDMMALQPDSAIGNEARARREKVEAQRDAMHQQTMAALAQALQQFAAVQAAPTEVIRDQKTGRVVGSQKRMH